jgi:homoaconitase/3-isopropylmalate dehydratase large subunit
MVAPHSLIVGTDSHMNLLGAVGSLSLGVGTTDIVATWKGGRLWFRVPESIRVTLSGKLRPPVSAKDIILMLLRETDTETLNYRSLEFVGEGTEGIDLAGRLTICSMITEAGGKVGFFPTNKAILDWLSPRMKEKPKPISADEGVKNEGAEYVREYHFDISSA